MKAAQITVMLLAVSIVGSYAAGRPLKEDLPAGLQLLAAARSLLDTGINTGGGSSYSNGPQCNGNGSNCADNRQQTSQTYGFGSTSGPQQNCNGQSGCNQQTGSNAQSTQQFGRHLKH